MRQVRCSGVRFGVGQRAGEREELLDVGLVGQVRAGELLKDDEVPQLELVLELELELEVPDPDILLFGKKAGGYAPWMFCSMLHSMQHATMYVQCYVASLRCYSGI